MLTLANGRYTLKHTNTLETGVGGSNGKDLLVRATGRFYTPDVIGEQLAANVADALLAVERHQLCISDPFCGDGRLICHLLVSLKQRIPGKQPILTIYLWDTDPLAVPKAKAKVEETLAHLGWSANVVIFVGDSFVKGLTALGTVDCVMTNPPWECLKPDRRELESLDDTIRQNYVTDLREYDKTLAINFPYSQPSKKFAGWGTNLSRCGLELSAKLLSASGVFGIVLPLSAASDQTSVELRKWLFNRFSVLSATHYPAEAKVFDLVDQNVVTLVVKNSPPKRSQPIHIVSMDQNLTVTSDVKVTMSTAVLEDMDYCIPQGECRTLLAMIAKWKALPAIADMEQDGTNPLRLGRELDETGYQKFLRKTGEVIFVKGAMVDRFRLSVEPPSFVDGAIVSIPKTVQVPRIAWRDVSRRNQERRMRAVIVPPSHVTGNSLHIAYFNTDDRLRLQALLVVMNSIPFEYQIRTSLGTGHLSLGVVRKARLPDLRQPVLVSLLNDIFDQVDRNCPRAEMTMEVLVAILYGLTQKEFGSVLAEFAGIGEPTKQLLVTHPLWEEAESIRQAVSATNADSSTIPSINALFPTIPNHYSAKLSSLDVQMAEAVPPGGSWKNIPTSIPSQRLEGIRRDFADGLGSHSTYYGRLRPDKPAYTINTYFGRPGNGCHLHYDFSGGQHRVISQREAARLQSFPDSFMFLGNRGDIGKQIGNAVPPLLGYCVAKSLPVVGDYVDLFAGAGGLGFGFKLAGWNPIVANDIVASYLATYEFNVHPHSILGDIRDPKVFKEMVSTVLAARRRDSRRPLFVLGGPPCQGFSTGGLYRSMDDERNHLFRDFQAFLREVKPDGFIFENVTGLLNMEQGRVFDAVKSFLSLTTERVSHWIVRAEEYAIPQRRTRVMILGSNLKEWDFTPPVRCTAMDTEATLFDVPTPAVTVAEALSDLPPLETGQDGSRLQYLTNPSSPYQQLMRGRITPEEYYANIGRPRSRKL